MAGALEGVRVVDLSQGIAGPFCTKLLAACGAEVIKVEPPAGDASRRVGPFPGDVPDPERSGRFLHLNTGKKSVTLELAASLGRERLRRLLAGADLLVESFAPGYLASLGLDFESLRGEFPQARSLDQAKQFIGKRKASDGVAARQGELGEALEAAHELVAFGE